MINKAILIGNLGKDPELKETAGGKTFARLSVATSKKYKQGDEWVEKTQWHNVTVWREATAKYLGGYAVKGTRVYVEGEIEYRTYEDEGVEKRATNIVVGGYDGDVKILAGSKKVERNDDAKKEDIAHPEDLDDEIPF